MFVEVDVIIFGLDEGRFVEGVLAVMFFLLLFNV